MKFNYDNVYTCLNADLLYFGSKVIFADDLYRLKKMVDADSSTSILSDVLEERQERRFVDQAGNRYSLAYLVKEKPKFDITKVLYYDNCKKAIIGKKYFYAEDLHRLRLHVEENDIDFSGELLDVEECNLVPFNLSTSPKVLWELIYPMED